MIGLTGFSLEKLAYLKEVLAHIKEAVSIFEAPKVADFAECLLPIQPSFKNE